MSVADHIRVIRDNFSMLVRNLSYDVGAFNGIIYTLHTEGVMSANRQNNMLVEDKNEVAEKVRNFLVWLETSSADSAETYMMFYIALKTHGFDKELQLLTNHERFQHTERLMVGTCSGLSA